MHFLTLPERVAEVQRNITAAVARGGHRQDVRIVAVTKTRGPEAVIAAVAAGLRDIGENKMQEAIGKQDALGVGIGAEPGDGLPGAKWHLIGHLQRNKVKALDRFSLFHAVDSVRLADAIAQWAAGRERRSDVLLEVNISGESSKGGLQPEAVEGEAIRLMGLPGIRVVGVMTMAPLDADEAMLRRVFSGARAARDVCVHVGHPATELSMGMSGDYEIAVEEGATMVRLGTVLFGERTP